ncbi:predicted protein [Sclerotinia sclerotiorum 1980 UF-70]|uniref:Uncharacterized protein n=1 Tax=Sclerotinia sclerotiorum (strain ATCC 18683 / 1980 / Ss-1) TaxID=665079 RepID=A7EEN2_SCLS1|nr:predicted protein [Sclerotinia sclerotiorum 1980 UF-70]EDO01298.1 predicted protein [Sclerotinia sclerotiorum 1980 UF-70]
MTAQQCFLYIEDFPPQKMKVDDLKYTIYIFLACPFPSVASEHLICPSGYIPTDYQMLTSDSTNHVLFEIAQMD